MITPELVLISQPLSDILTKSEKNHFQREVREGNSIEEEGFLVIKIIILDIEVIL